jgi:hypothetical protein
LLVKRNFMKTLFMAQNAGASKAYRYHSMQGQP